MAPHDCCAPAPSAQAPRPPCPGCAGVGRPVAEETLHGLLAPDALAGLGPQGRSVCRTPTCPVLYFAADGSAVDKAQARVRIGFKEALGPRPLCYCFGHTYEDVAREVAAAGGVCTIPARITAEVRAGACACERMNPAGSCCLGEVNRVVKEARLAAGFAAEAPPRPGTAQEGGGTVAS